MEQGGNLVDLMNTLGHSNIQTTAIYLRFAPTHLESVPKLNPLAGLNI
jgi:site-specific recombinase XerD